MMLRAVLLQCLALMVVAAAAELIAGGHAAVSALLGGLSCVLPNGLFALHLALLARMRGTSRGDAGATATAAALLAGEFLNIALTIGILVLVAWAYKDLVWPALIVTLIAVKWMQAAALIWR